MSKLKQSIIDDVIHLFNHTDYSQKEIGDIVGIKNTGVWYILKKHNLKKNWNQIKIKKNCEKCHIDFYVYHCYSDQKYCSKQCADKSRKSSWNKGLHHSPTHIQNLKLAKINQPSNATGKTWKLSPEILSKRKKLTGEKSPVWKGGHSIHVHSGSVEYKQWRKSVFERDNNYTCQKCGAKSKKGENVYLQAHHIQEWAKYIHLRFCINNGITLCKPCHKFLHSLQSKLKIKIRFDIRTIMIKNNINLLELYNLRNFVDDGWNVWGENLFIAQQSQSQQQLISQ